MLQQIQIAAPCPVSSETGFFWQPAGGDEVLDGALDGGFGQTRVAGPYRFLLTGSKVLSDSLRISAIDWHP